MLFLTAEKPITPVTEENTVEGLNINGSPKECPYYEVYWNGELVKHSKTVAEYSGSFFPTSNTTLISSLTKKGDLNGDKKVDIIALGIFFSDAVQNF